MIVDEFRNKLIDIGFSHCLKNEKIDMLESSNIKVTISLETPVVIVEYMEFVSRHHVFESNSHSNYLDEVFEYVTQLLVKTVLAS